MNKYNYMYVLQGHYAVYGWEDLTAAAHTSAGFKEVRRDMKDYRENASGNYRIIERRVLNPENNNETH